MKKIDILGHFQKLSIWQKGGQRAPHKPLMVLFALARLQGGQRWLNFKNIDKQFMELLRTYGPPRKSYHTLYPFWYLQSDGIWKVLKLGKLGSRKGKVNPNVA